MTPASGRWLEFWGAIKAAFGACPDYGVTCSNCHPGLGDRSAIREAFESAIAAAVAEERENNARLCEAVRCRQWSPQECAAQIRARGKP